jgi:hypothetical protein
MKQNKPHKIKLTQRMSYKEVCSVLGLDEKKSDQLWEILKTSSVSEINKGNRVVDIMGYDNYILFKKWYY